MRRPSRQADADDGSLAAATRFAGPAVGMELVLKIALEARTADIIANSGTAIIDCPGQHRDDGFSQSIRFRRRYFQDRGDAGRASR